MCRYLMALNRSVWHYCLITFRRILCHGELSHRFMKLVFMWWPWWWFVFPRFSGLTKETVSLDTLSPPAHKYSDLRAYNDSKLCNVLFAWSLDDKLRGQGVRSFSLHPGNMMSTSLSRHWWLYRLLFALVRPFTKSMVCIVSCLLSLSRQELHLQFKTWFLLNLQK